MKDMIATLRFDPTGTGHCLYHEFIDLQELGQLSCERASEVEFYATSQQWEVRRAEQDQLLFQSPSRSACLKWEREHLDPVLKRSGGS